MHQRDVLRIKMSALRGIKNLKLGMFGYAIRYAYPTYKVETIIMRVTVYEDNNIKSASTIRGMLFSIHALYIRYGRIIMRVTIHKDNTTTVSQKNNITKKRFQKNTKYATRKINRSTGGNLFFVV